MACHPLKRKKFTFQASVTALSLHWDQTLIFEFAKNSNVSFTKQNKIILILCFISKAFEQFWWEPPTWGSERQKFTEAVFPFWRPAGAGPWRRCDCAQKARLASIWRALDSKPARPANPFVCQTGDCARARKSLSFFDGWVWGGSAEAAAIAQLPPPPGCFSASNTCTEMGAALPQHWEKCTWLLSILACFSWCNSWISWN